MYPIMFTIPGINLPIYSYGIMLGLSLVVGWMIIMRLGSADGLSKDKMAACFIYTAIAAIAGSRILYIVTNLHEFANGGIMDIVNLRKGGLVAYGGFVGGFLGSWIYLKRQKIRLLPWADVVVLTLSSGLGITRIGCFLFGCDYGKPIGHDASGFIKAIALRFPNWDVKYAAMRDKVGDSLGNLEGAPAYLHHVSAGLVERGAAHSAHVYPTQLIEVLNGWLAFGMLMFVRRKIRFRGQVFCIFTMYYGITRALMEIIRGDTGRGGIWLLSTSQIIGIITFVVALMAYYVLSRSAAKDPEAAMSLGSGAAVGAVVDQQVESPKIVRRKVRKKKK